MKAGDIIATNNNTLIKSATLSGWSHVGIAIDEKYILEAVPKGVIKTDIADIVKSSKEVLLLVRPEPLTEQQILKLKNRTEELINKNIKYGTLRAAYSGAPHILTNMFKALALVLLTGSCISFFLFDDLKSSYPLLLLSVVSVFIGIPIAKSTGAVRETNRFLKKCKAPKWLLTNMDKMFCSQLVEDVDLHIGGNLTSYMSRSHELRPKDVVNACISLQWSEENITSTSNGTKTVG